MNLESSQKKISREQGVDLEIPILFLPQFLGLAMGKTPEEVGLDKNLSNTSRVLARAI
jgi:heterodisulfide reductase subunit B